MKIIVTEDTITLSETGWSCDIILSNKPGTQYDLKPFGFHATASGEPYGTITYRVKDEEKAT